MYTLNAGRVSAFVLGAALLSGAAPRVRADIVPWEFVGEVTSIANPGGLTTPIALGQQVRGTYTFDETTFDVLPTPDGGVAYLFFFPDFPHPPYGLNATIGDATVESGGDFSPSLNVIVHDGTAPAGGDQLRLVDVGLTTSFVVPPQSTLFMDLTLQDTSGAVLASDALPLVPPPLESFTGAEGSFAILDDASGEFAYSMTFRIDSLVLVPSPGAGAVIGLAFLTRRRRRG
ncbi:MAG: hypothetical protein AB7G11_06385 [Phycisphaerales bacterium]